MKNIQPKILLLLPLLLLFFSAKIVWANAPLPEPVLLGFPQHITIAVAVGIVSLVIEMIVGYFLLRHVRWGVLAILVANLISYPLFCLWLIHSLGVLFVNFFSAVFVGEVGVVLFEAAVIKIIFKDKIKFERALFISFVINSASLIAGLLLALGLYE